MSAPTYKPRRNDIRCIFTMAPPFVTVLVYDGEGWKQEAQR